MSFTAAERRQVFLACKAIFSGPHALFRKLKIITKLVTKHKSSLCTLIPDFNINRVSLIAQELLKDRVFESDIKARLIFPDLPASSTTKKSEQDSFGDEATRMVAETVRESEPVSDRQECETTQIPPVSVSVEVEASAEERTCIDRAITCLPSPPLSAEPELRIPSLYPLYFPYHAQHSILSQVQQVLEECCFDFTKKWLPLELESHGWDCAAAVELTKWTRLLMEWSPQLPDGSLQSNGSEFRERLANVSGIRHTAVHRIPTTARGIDTLVVSAMRLTEALRDTLRTSQLEDLHLDIQAKIEAMEFNKNALEEHLSRELEAIQRQREELDRKEVELRAKTIANDNENRGLMGLLVRESMERIFSNGTYENSSTGFVTADERAEDD